MQVIFQKVLYFPITNLPVGVLLKARPQNRLLLLENIIVNQKYQHDRIPRLTCTCSITKCHNDSLGLKLVYLRISLTFFLSFLMFSLKFMNMQIRYLALRTIGGKDNVKAFK